MEFNRHVAVLDKLKDCSANFWFDRKKSLLMGSGLALPVPKHAVSDMADQYVRIDIKSRFHGFPTKWLVVPESPKSSDGWHQNILGVRGKIASVRNQLTKTWDTKFVKGVPDGPDRQSGQVAYFSESPKGRPSLNSESPEDIETDINCPFELPVVGK